MNPVAVRPALPERLSVRVLWIYGPPAAGKSKTAWATAQLLATTEPATAFLDIDQLGMLRPRPTGDRDSHRLKALGLAAVAEQFERFCTSTVVVAGVLDPQLIPTYRHLLAPFDLAFVRLTIPADELHLRMRARGRTEDDWVGLAEECQRYETSALEHQVVSASGGTPVEVARRVLAAASDEEPARAEADWPDEPSARAPRPRAILIGGTTGIGRSTVTWELYRLLRARSLSVAFVDLRQLGLVGPAGSEEHHVLQARTAAALCGVYLDHGAETLLLNGPVCTSPELSHYRTALDPISVSAVRLVADRTTLLERIRLHAAGQAIDLEGDPIRGLPDAAIELVAAEALERQASELDSAAFPSLETTGRRSCEVAADLVERLSL